MSDDQTTTGTVRSTTGTAGTTSERPSVAATKRALARLATAPSQGPDRPTGRRQLRPAPTPDRPSPSATAAADSLLDRARRAMADLDRAAAFVDDGGPERLERVARQAEEGGDTATAADCRDVLETLRRYREAAETTERI